MLTDLSYEDDEVPVQETEQLLDVLGSSKRARPEALRAGGAPPQTSQSQRNIIRHPPTSIKEKEGDTGTHHNNETEMTEVLSRLDQIVVVVTKMQENILNLQAEMQKRDAIIEKLAEQNALITERQEQTERTINRIETILNMTRKRTQSLSHYSQDETPNKVVIPDSENTNIPREHDTQHE